MKIFINLLQCHSEKTGTGRYVLNLMEQIAEFDIDNEYYQIVSIDNHKHYRIEKNNFFQIIVPIKISNRVLRILYEQFVLIFILKKHRKKDSVLWSPNDIPILLWFGTQYITIHDLRRIFFPTYFSLIERLYYRLMLFFSTIISKKIITVSKSSLNDISNYYKISKDKIVVTYNAVEKIFLASNDSNSTDVLNKYNIRKPYILFLGHQLKIKSPHLLVESFELIHKDFPNLNLVIVGRPANATKTILKFIQKKNLGEYVKIVKWIEDNELKIILSNSKIFVFPSLYEGFGIPIIEAMSCCVPVITTSYSCLPEIGGDAAIYVDPLNINNLAASITLLLLDDNKRDELVKKGIENLKRFNWLESAKILHKTLTQNK